MSYQALAEKKVNQPMTQNQAPSHHSKSVAKEALGHPSKFFNFTLMTLDGRKMETSELQKASNKAFLIVNTASKCGYTVQYEALEKLYQRYQNQGLQVLGFPSNDFGGQEPGTNEEIHEFCSLKFKVDFPMFAKDSVSGSSIQPLFKWLIDSAPSNESIGWNFEKFLVNAKGEVVARYKSSVTPLGEPLESDIQKLLKGE